MLPGQPSSLTAQAASAVGTAPAVQPQARSYDAVFDELTRMTPRADRAADVSSLTLQRDIGRFTIYVTDMAVYRASRKALGDVYRHRMGAHFPAMALVEVKSLVDLGAVVEIEATAVLG